MDGLQALSVGLRCRKLWAQKAQQTALEDSQVNAAVEPINPSDSVKAPLLDKTFPVEVVPPTPLLIVFTADEPLRSLTT